MDIINHLTHPSSSHPSPPITVLDMHTTGEPTRIILSGYPSLPSGTLLSQRTSAQTHHDHLRRHILLEPRGHKDMYGALLRPHTEHTDTGAAHIGVLFLTNDGYSTMCGHATIALGRFLVDTWDLSVFPRRGEVVVDERTRTANVLLHAPCGVVDVTVPVSADGRASDPTRPVEFVNVASFATGVGVRVEVPESLRWVELQGRESVSVDFAYGGAFYCFVDVQELGFDGLERIDFEAVNRATRLLKRVVSEDPKYRDLFKHPEHEELGFLYSVMVVDKRLGVVGKRADGAETGLCFFSDQQVDRSPTGSAVAARDALHVAKGEAKVGRRWTYHSLLSNAFEGKGGFDSEIVKIEERDDQFNLVWSKVSGFAFYTGTSTFFVEDTDVLGKDGFVFDKLAA